MKKILLISLTLLCAFAIKLNASITYEQYGYPGYGYQGYGYGYGAPPAPFPQIEIKTANE
jgi:hypothetical protein